MLVATENISINRFNYNSSRLGSRQNNVSLQNLYNSLLLKLVLPITVFSVSWFITDDSGNIQKNGVAQIENVEIDISNLPKGNYSIRLMGEVHNFELS